MAKKERSLEKQLLSLMGEFAVASQLCLQKKHASLTVKNYPEIDIFVHDPSTGKQASIQVKTTQQRRKKNWEKDQFKLGKDLSKIKIKNPFVFVYKQNDGKLRFFIVPPDDVGRLAKQYSEHYKKDSRHKKPEEELKEVWDVIELSTLLPFENKWDKIWAQDT